MFNVYFDTEQEFNEEQNLIIKVAQIFRNDAINITEEFDVQKGEVCTFKGPVTVQKIKADYIIQGVIPCLGKILKKGLIFNAKKKREIAEDMVNSIMKLNYLVNYEENELAIIEEFLHLIEQLNLKISINYEYQIKQEKRSKKEALGFTRQVTVSIGRPQNREILKTKFLTFEDCKAEIQLQQLLEIIKTDSKYQNAVQDEFNQQIQYILDIEENTQNTSFAVNSEELLMSLIDMVDPSKITLDEGLMQIVLKILRKIVEVENAEKENAFEISIDQ
eukprot:TRINITY_DN2652_c0_g1_i6.p4 TRINITY_DN2652_c0_g1~~TRINITY_DN2652_c0_g1_i6.p4  ORF type:complete len:276 (+),score=53.10 TRINITY_DN2652_c0_g1_i6:1797-2624(+)